MVSRLRSVVGRRGLKAGQFGGGFGVVGAFAREAFLGGMVFGLRVKYTQFADREELFSRGGVHMIY